MIDIETRNVSRAGVDLTGKNVSVIYGQCGNLSNDVFLQGISEGFSKGLREKYSDTVGNIDTFSLNSASEYANRDSLLNLLIETGADVVFLFDHATLGHNKTFSYIISCYDGMNQEDKVQLFSGNHLAKSIDTADMIKKEALEAGEDVARAFEPQWKPEIFSLYYYNSTPWYDAIEKAEKFDWKGAMDIWMGLIDTYDTMKRASLSYNLATACYMLGEYELALEWLNRADKEADLLVSDGLRQRINSSLQGRK